MGNLKLVCHACKYEIASFSKDVKLPLMGAMFLSKDEKHGFPAPWPPVITWEHMVCPMCQNRPFPAEDDNGDLEVLTDNGYMIINDRGISVEKGDSCDQFADGLQPNCEIIPNRGYTFTPVIKNEEKIQPNVSNDDGGLSESESEPEKENEEVVEPSVDAPDLVESENVDVPEVSEEDEGEEADPIGEEVEPDDQPPVPSFDFLLSKGDITQHGSWYEFEGKKYRKAELENILNG